MDSNDWETIRFKFLCIQSIQKMSCLQIELIDINPNCKCVIYNYRSTLRTCVVILNYVHVVLYIYAPSLSF